MSWSKELQSNEVSWMIPVIAIVCIGVLFFY